MNAPTFELIAPPSSPPCVDDPDTWRTPLWLYDILDDEVGGFTLDAACRRESCLAPRGFYHDEGIDAFDHDWVEASGGGPIFCNPPYSRGLIDRFVRACADAGELVPVTALIRHDPSTKWYFDDIALRAVDVRTIHGRLRFRADDGRAAATKANFVSSVVRWRPGTVRGYERQAGTRVWVPQQHKRKA